MSYLLSVIECAHVCVSVCGVVVVLVAFLNSSFFGSPTTDSSWHLVVKDSYSHSRIVSAVPAHYRLLNSLVRTVQPPSSQIRVLYAVEQREKLSAA